MRRPPGELREFLSAYDARLSSLFIAVRKAVLTSAPRANELIYDAYNAVSVAYSYSERLAEAFCHVAAYENHVNLGFNRGVELSDPAGLLVGSGARIRHVRIQSVGDLRRAPVRALLEAAAAQGAGLVTELPKSPTHFVQNTSGSKRRPNPT